MASEQREFEVARRTRYFVVLACRASAMLLIVIGAIQALAGLRLYLRTRPMVNAGLVSDEVGMYGFLSSLLIIAPGVVLALGSNAISRWIAPAPDFKCLRCGYDAEKSKSERCPECGSALGVEFGETGAAGASDDL